jgi:DnaK suppressor protein
MEAERADELLRRERRRVERALAGLRTGRGHDDELAHVDQHPAEAATELQLEEQEDGMAQQLRGELEAIERAERRLLAGTYGLSVESGEPIPDARLEAVPWAERTLEEQARFERRA